MAAVGVSTPTSAARLTEIATCQVIHSTAMDFASPAALAQMSLETNEQLSGEGYLLANLWHAFTISAGAKLTTHHRESTSIPS